MMWNGMAQSCRLMNEYGWTQPLFYMFVEGACEVCEFGVCEFVSLEFGVWEFRSE